MSESEFDIIIIGAGISGVGFARFYMDIHPECRLLILEEDSCIGGVWSSSRLYDEFWTQSGRRMLGYSDLPLNIPADAPSFHGCIEAKYVTKYLEEYIDRHIYNGRSLRSRIHLENRVQSTEKIGNMWKVISQDARNGLRSFRSSKLVVATGLTSQPHMPTFPQSHNRYEGPIRHHKQFGDVSRTLLTNPKYQNVVVLGAGKSATDMVYASVKKGKNISWIIRKKGEGPALFFTAPGGGRYENSTEAGATRLSAAFSPSSFMSRNLLARLVYGTQTGMNYLSKRITAGDQSCRDAAAYQDRKGALAGFQNLETTTSAFWCTGPLGLAQHDDFWDVLAKNVHVYRNDISSMKAHSIVLDDGSEIPADILLCGTGWEFSCPFFSKDQVRSLGLPHSPEDDKPEDAELWSYLLGAADRRVLTDFPILKYPPPHQKPELRTTNIRLYNCIVPLGDSSIVFLGRAHLSNSFRTAEAQGIWATALFDGRVRLPSLEQAQWDVAYMNAVSRRRYPSHGAAGDYLFFELVSYTDKLLTQIGLKSHRKGWWTDWVEPCLASDLSDMADEYRKIVRS